MSNAFEKLQRAAQLLQRGAAGEARDALAAIVAHDPGNVDALSLLGIALTQCQDLNGAADALRRATAVAPQHAGAQMNYGLVLRRLGRPQEAVARFERAAALRTDAPLPALRQLSGALLDLQRYEQAVAVCSHMLSLQAKDPVALNDRGLAFIGLDRFEDALADFDTALALDQRFASALANKAVALARLRRSTEALATHDAALALEPNNRLFLRAKGHALLIAKEYAAALACFDRAIATGSPDATDWALRAEALIRLARPAEAEQCFERAVSLDPQHWDALIGLGECYIDVERFGAAVELFNRAASVRPASATAYIGRARAACGLRNWAAALHDADRAIEVEPANIEALELRIALKRDQAQREDALADCDRAIALEPTNWNLHNCRGVVLDEMGRGAEALVCFERAVELEPANTTALRNLGAVLTQLRRGDEALVRCEENLQRVPEDADLWLMKGTILGSMYRFDEALTALDRAIALRPDLAPAHFSRAGVLLTQGRLREGFDAYEWRRRGKPPLILLPQFETPELPSLEEARGKRLMLYCEQGLGDMIQFARFVRPLAERGANVSVLAYPTLERLFASLGDDISILPPTSSDYGADFVYPLMSTAHLFSATLDTIPGRPYLRAPDASLEVWRCRLAAQSKGELRVGLAWSGNTAHVADWARTIPLRTLERLLAIPGVVFYSVQKDVRASDERTLVDSAIVDHREQLTDMAETAAFISSLDLVITVDTSVAHLAGALGKPVWIMIATRVDWRWMTNTDVSTWYPSARLFRQSRPGDWDDVVTDVEAALRKLASAQ